MQTKPQRIVICIYKLNVCRFFIAESQDESSKESQASLDNKHNAEQQREQYYATIHKAALAEKVPENAEDISPYATFHLAETARAHTPRRAQPAPGPPHLLHSFMYHEQPGTEGCASPPQLSVSQSSSPGTCTSLVVLTWGRVSACRCTGRAGDGAAPAARAA